MRLLILILSIISLKGYAQTTNKGVITVKKPDDSIYTMPETMPELPGGNMALNKVFAKMQYPQRAIDNGISGVCFITFVIEKDGKVGEVRVLRGVQGCPECDLEAIRVVSSMPDWKPGTKGGQPVRVQYNIPIKFNLR